MILADIAQGKTAGADVCFLVALILFAIAAVLSLFGGPGEPATRGGPYYAGSLHRFLVAAGLALTALGLMLL